MSKNERHDGPQGTRIMESSDLPVSSNSGGVNTHKSKSATLLGLQDPYKGQRFDLVPPRVTIGRDKANDIVLDNEGVSAQHARLAFEKGQWKVVNLLSSNGTFVNDSKVSQYRLNHGDVLRFGAVTLRFESDTSGGGHALYWTIGAVAVAVAGYLIWLFI